MRTLLVICNTGRLCPAELLGELSRRMIGEHVAGAANDRVRRDRLASYLILKGALDAMGLSLTDLGHGERGEPIAVIEGGAVAHVSISHSGDITAVAVGDSPLGVDIEAEISPERAEKLERRFLSERGIERATLGVGEIDISTAYLDRDGKLIITGELAPKKEEEALYVNNDLHIRRFCPFESTSARWTSLEALLKVCGGGFADFLNTGAIADIAGLVCYEIISGEDVLYLSLAEKKK